MHQTRDFESWGEFIKKNKVDFRYIELMQTGDNLDYFKKYHVSSKIFKEYLNKNNWIYQTLGKRFWAVTKLYQSRI